MHKLLVANACTTLWLLFTSAGYIQHLNPLFVGSPSLHLSLPWPVGAPELAIGWIGGHKIGKLEKLCAWNKQSRSKVYSRRIKNLH